MKTYIFIVFSIALTQSKVIIKICETQLLNSIKIMLYVNNEQKIKRINFCITQKLILLKLLIYELSSSLFRIQ